MRQLGCRLGRSISTASSGVKDSQAHGLTLVQRMHGQHLAAPWFAVHGSQLCTSPTGCASERCVSHQPPCPHNREPLAPVDVGEWDRRCLQGLQHWEAGDAPFTTAAGLQPALPSSCGSLLSGGAFGGVSNLASDPAAQAVLRTIVGARRGLIVAAELTSPEDVVAATQLSQLLGWPVAADVLSGLRAGVPAAGAAGTAGAAGPAVIHHMDNLLLLDRQQWRALRPDVVLQVGGHLTSKRVGQFLEWCCLEGEGQPGSSQEASSSSSLGAAATQRPLQWVLVDRSPKRHDQFALLSYRLQAPLPALAAALAAHLAEVGTAQQAAQQAAQRQEQTLYCRLLQLLDAEASAAVDAVLAAMPELTEPAVARALSQQLPPGEQCVTLVGNVFRH